MAEIVLKSTIDVEDIQHMGSDERCAHAAWVSTRGLMADKQDPGKVEGVLKFLMQNRHGTPFECGSLTVRVHAPIKVWREWHRHRIGHSYNEESGRYKKLDPVFWLPPPERPMIEDTTFKASSPVFRPPTPVEYEEVKATLKVGYEAEYTRYERLLEMKVDKGLARDVLGVGLFSACYVTVNPRSIMTFLELRTKMDPTVAKRPSKPLWEIDNAARQLEVIFKTHWPLTHRLWDENGRMAP